VEAGLDGDANPPVPFDLGRRTVVPDTAAESA
jgi:hypothetical protein